MDILISCQCEATHDPIYIFDASGDFRPLASLTADELSDVNINSFSFIDIECDQSNRQYTSWASVPDASRDAIYLMNCPVYNELRDPHHRITTMSRTIWSNLMNDAWRVLRPGGKIIIPPLMGAPYPKRNASGKIMKGQNGRFMQIAVEDDAEYQKDNAIKTLAILKNDYNISIPKWDIATALTSAIPFRIAIVFSGHNAAQELENAKNIPEKHIIFTKPANAVGGKRRFSRLTQKNDRHRSKTRRTRR